MYIYIYMYIHIYIYDCTYVQLFWGNASIWHTYIYIVVKMLRLWLINLAVHVMQYINLNIRHTLANLLVHG